jgi:hypothetical protein
MVDTLDALLVGAGAYYTTTKLQDNDNDFERLLVGAAVGIPAALKGPEAYEAAKDYISDQGGLDKATKNKVAGSLLFGAGGYAVGDNLFGPSDDTAYDTPRIDE